MAFIQENDNIGGGFGVGGFGGGGAWSMIILAVIVLWFLRDGRGFGNDGRGYGNGYGDGCYHPMGRPYFPDESNYEEERNINDKLCKLQEVEHSEGEKTRALIEANYIQDLRDKLADKNAEVLTLKSEAFTAGLFGKLDSKIEHLACELPKRPPVFSTCSVPCNQEIVTGCGGGPRRGFCDEGFAFA